MCALRWKVGTEDGPTEKLSPVLCGSVSREFIHQIGAYLTRNLSVWSFLFFFNSCFVLLLIFLFLKILFSRFLNVGEMESHFL
jgi:hypothetical protein